MRLRLRLQGLGRRRSRSSGGRRRQAKEMADEEARWWRACSSPSPSSSSCRRHGCVALACLVFFVCRWSLCESLCETEEAWMRDVVRAWIQRARRRRLACFSCPPSAASAMRGVCVQLAPPNRMRIASMTRISRQRLTLFAHASCFISGAAPRLSSLSSSSAYRQRTGAALRTCKRPCACVPARPPPFYG